MRPCPALAFATALPLAVLAVVVACLLYLLVPRRASVEDLYR